MRDHKPQVHVAIASRYEEIELVQIVVEASLEELSLDDQTASGIGLAVREAVANAIQHGNRQDPGKKVEVELGVNGDMVTIRVRDQGDGFDPGILPDPLRPENLLSTGGRGVFFMKSFMDEIDYSFQPEGGTVVTLRKRLFAPPQESSRKPEERHR